MLVTVVVTTPPGPFVTVVVSPDEDDDAVEVDVADVADDTASDAGLTAEVELADPLELAEALAVPSAATALLILIIFISDFLTPIAHLPTGA